MKIVKIYKEDLQIAHAILMRDGQATREYMYLKCYPLFKANYKTIVERVLLQLGLRL